jgi:RNA polymerase sigma-70 factor (ECF subfamily)
MGMLALYLGMLETEEEQKNFADYYEKHKGLCIRVALAITKNQAWAEEAVHNAFLKMIRHKEKYFTESCKRTASQIVIMVKSAAIDLIRKEKRLDHVSLDNVEPIIANKAPDALRIVAGKEAIDRLQYHISQLNEVNRTMYRMRYILGMTDGEIAEAVGSNNNAVSVRLHRITKGLFEALREEGHFDG